MTINEIYSECETVIENEMLDSLLWYLQEYSNQRNDFAESFKKAFCQVLKELANGN